jgi:demethylmenaquinone methyltransferase/2-methoxy-6-polyprenyl-1,4-benzoquinol methylase
VSTRAQSDEERQKSSAVCEMFGTIAPRYDLLNHLLSGGTDRRWRKVCVDEVWRRLGPAACRILDLGCGTGDLSMNFAAPARVTGCDFCQPMLRIGSDKVCRAGRAGQITFLAADALALPFPDGRFDAVVSAFVLRNLASIDLGLVEMRRVLRPGGVLGILDFSIPRAPLLGGIYRFYFHRILPRVGRIISGVDGPYRYLPESVGGFPRPLELSAQIKSAGFGAVEYRLLTGGIAVLLMGVAE